MNSYNGLRKTFIRNRGLVFLALPAIVYIFIFNYIPLYGIILPFKNFKFNLGFWKSQWVGFENFRFLFTSNEIYQITFNTLTYNFIFIFLGAFLAVCAALMLFELGSRSTKAYQTIMFFPFFISWAVVSYLMLSLLDMDYGIINRLLGIFGVQPVFWYNDPKYWPFILVVAGIWKGLGNGTVIYYAGLMNINTEYYEAARIDGASKLQQITKISVPLLKPLIVMMILFGLGRIFYGDFGLFYNIPLNQPSLYHATEVIDTYVFRIMRSMGDINMSSAAGLYQSAVGFILVIISNWLVKINNEELSLF